MVEDSRGAGAPQVVLAKGVDQLEIKVVLPKPHLDFLNVFLLGDHGRGMQEPFLIVAIIGWAGCHSLGQDLALPGFQGLGVGEAGVGLCDELFDPIFGLRLGRQVLGVRGRDSFLVNAFC